MVRIPFSNVFREWRELTRFQSLDPSDKTIVFYAENGGSWVHFSGIIDHLLNEHGLRICYVTSSPDDPILHLREDRIQTFCIGLGSARTRLFQSLQTNVMVMTMPDLDTFHIKRSQYPVHYVYVFHSMLGTQMLRPAALDNFDSVLCVGPHHEEEIRAREALRGLEPKTLVRHGYERLDSILRETESRPPGLPQGSKVGLQVAIAPTFGETSILETCGVELIEVLVAASYNVVVRPHPVTTANSSDLIEELVRTFEGNPRARFDFDMASQETFHTSDIMISDWSGVALEYAFGLERPVIFIDVPRPLLFKDLDKEVYESYLRELNVEPIEAYIRSEIGAVVSQENLADIPTLIDRFTEDSQRFSQRIKSLRQKTVYNVGSSAAAGAAYIAGLLEPENSK